MKETEKVDLKGMPVQELENLFNKWGEPAYRARQVVNWIYKNQVDSFASMSNLPKRLRTFLVKTARIGRITLKTNEIDADGTEKYLFELEDGNNIESVAIPEANRLTACISTQVGCSIGCPFCATGHSGLIRNLTAAEIIDQVLKMQKLRDKRITNVVFMGMGEPFLNYQAVKKALYVMIDDAAMSVGQRHITISTAGVVPRIFDLADERLQIKLAVSLHAATDELRDGLVPINRKYPLHDLFRSCRYYSNTTRRRITFEYVLIKDVNDHKHHAQLLVDKLSDINCHLNLIPLNPLNVDSDIWQQSDKKKVKEFLTVCCQGGISASLRKERGKDIKAACGQLRYRKSIYT